MSIPVAELRPRFDGSVGFVSPPAANDYCVQQFTGLAPGRVMAMQNMPFYEGADYGDDLPDPERRLAHLREGIAGLAHSKLDLIAQIGGYWSLPYAPTYERAKALEAELSAEFGLPVILNWVAIAEALHHLDATTITVATGYYRPRWTEATVAFLESAGFTVAWAGDVIDQGLVADRAEKEAIEAATNWDYPDELVAGACTLAAELAPEADVICQTGAGMRTLYVVDEVEAATGKPLVATDLALFWAVLTRLGVAADPGQGTLLATTVD